jgi:hypothetical protein
MFETPWLREELDAFVVWCSTGKNIYFMNSWIDFYDALRERDSLNESDTVAHYYITYMGAIL